MNDKRFNMARLKIRIPLLSSSIRCPVCRKYSYTPETCLEHLFAECLFVENGECSLVRDWLTEYFSSKTENGLNVLRDVLSNHSASRVTCKYCKTEAPDQQSLMKHFPCPQRRQANGSELMCELCNFSVPNLQRLVAHLVAKHYKCHSCGIWPKNRRVDWLALRHHVQGCDPRRAPFFRCPLCDVELAAEAEHSVTAHIAVCRRTRAETAFDNWSLYGKCDVINCTDQVLLCDVDAHMTKHLRNGDLPSSRQKRLRVSVNDLQDCVVNNYSERKNTVCVCTGSCR